MLKEEMLLNNKGTREEMLNKVEVLDKVKELFLLPELNVMTSKQVAEYYEVPPETIKKLVQANKEELHLNGAKQMGYKEIKEVLLRGIESPLRENAPRIINTLSKRINTVFSKRAVLNVGMLLRDSVIAKEVRNALLDQQEVMTPIQKTAGIDREKELIAAVVLAKDEMESMLALREYNEYKNRHIKQLEETIEHQKPKVEYADHVLQAEGSHTTSSISDDYGKSAIAFNKILHDLGIQYTQSGRWYLYQQHKGNGYTETKTFTPKKGNYTNIQMKWTNKGRYFIYETLKEQGIYPNQDNLHKYVGVGKAAL